MMNERINLRLNYPVEDEVAGIYEPFSLYKDLTEQHHQMSMSHLIYYDLINNSCKKIWWNSIL